jgi:hypothetical protein
VDASVSCGLAAAMGMAQLSQNPSYAFGPSGSTLLTLC